MLRQLFYGKISFIVLVPGDQLFSEYSSYGEFSLVWSLLTIKCFWRQEKEIRFSIDSYLLKVDKPISGDIYLPLLAMDKA